MNTWAIVGISYAAVVAFALTAIAVGKATDRWMAEKRQASEGERPGLIGPGPAPTSQTDQSATTPGRGPSTPSDDLSPRNRNPWRI